MSKIANRCPWPLLRIDVSVFVDPDIEVWDLLGKRV